MSKQQLTTNKIREAIAKLKPLNINDLIDQAFFSLDNKRNKSDWTSDGNCYEWYIAIGDYFRPEKILEIGVRFGYSLMALGLGSKAKELTGYDTEEYEPGSNDRAQAAISERLRGARVKIEKIDSHSLAGLTEHYDLISIDGDHCYAGTLEDLELTVGMCHVVVIDDYSFLGDVKRAIDHFLDTRKEYIAHSIFLPSYRGTYVIIYK